MRTAALGLLVATSLVAWASPAAAAGPISVTVLEQGKARVLIAAERVKPDRLRITVLSLQTDDVNADNESAIMLRRNRCGARKRPLVARIVTRAGEVTTVTRKVPRAALAGPLSWVLPEVDDEVLVCARAGASRPGSVHVLRDTGRGESTGVVGVQRSAGSLRVSALVNGLTGKLAAGTAPCDQLTGDSGLDYFFVVVRNWVAIETVSLADFEAEAWQSIALVDDVGTPLACAPR